MIIFKKADQLSAYLEKEGRKGKKIGFAPTMGALHAGHLSLIAASRAENALTVCSIFVNPTQFNNPDDFRHYPVTLDKDVEQLLSAGCDLLFLPTVEEIYPAGWKARHYELGPIETVLEGAHRPGHFQGVCQVMDRLLSIVRPDRLYMGQKDFQQCLVVRKLLELTGRASSVAFRTVPTMREGDGLAMSSRNLRLDAGQRDRATALIRALEGIRAQLGRKENGALEDEARRQLEDQGFRVDYVSIARAEDLMPGGPGGKQVALVAAALGPVRLIDNLPLN